jgi:hypothetical protein
MLTSRKRKGKKMIMNCLKIREMRYFNVGVFFEHQEGFGQTVFGMGQEEYPNIYKIIEEVKNDGIELNQDRVNIAVLSVVEVSSEDYETFWKNEK